MAATSHDPLAPPHLVGRDRELATLHAALAAALAGHGSLVLIGGEAGIGKTALAEALLTEAEHQGALVLVGRCYDLTETPPYGPWAEALARAPVDGVPPPLPTAVLPGGRDGAALASQGSVLRRVRDSLVALAARRRLVLLLDDLHWADPASLDLLRLVGRGLAALPLLLLATYRADEVADDHPLAALLPPLVREARAERLDLRPLDPAAIDALVAARYALTDLDRARLVGYLADRTEGNALFLGELLRTLEGEGLLRRDGTGWAVGELASVPVPPLLRQVIAGRVARLDPETWSLLTVAAVIGQEVLLTLWAAVAAVPEEALLEHAAPATAARLLIETPDGTSVRFAHALIREALYGGTSTLRRRALHRRVGETLLAASAPDPDAVADHLMRAGDPRALDWLVRAGFRAYRAVAWHTAAARFAAAAGLAGAAGRERERAWLLFAGAWLLRFSGGEALHLLDEAERAALRGGERALAAEIACQIGAARCIGGSVREGLADLERGLAVLEAQPPALYPTPRTRRR